MDYLQTPAEDRALTVEAAPWPGPPTCSVQTKANLTQHGFNLTRATFILLRTLTGKNAHFG